MAHPSFALLVIIAIRLPFCFLINIALEISPNNSFTQGFTKLRDALIDLAACAPDYDLSTWMPHIVHYLRRDLTPAFGGLSRFLMEKAVSSRSAEVTSSLFWHLNIASLSTSDPYALVYRLILDELICRLSQSRAYGSNKYSSIAMLYAIIIKSLAQ